jgi:hypothetical protein
VRRRKGQRVEKILINKQEITAAASKEGSIIDTGTAPTLNTVAAERGKKLRSARVRCMQMLAPSCPLLVTHAVRKLAKRNATK